jgi:antitoxin HicB
MRYPALIEPDTVGFVVSFRDIPEALTGAPSIDEARFMAADVLLESMDVYFEERRAVPPPSDPLPGEELIALPASAAAKVLLLNEMIAQRVPPGELARRLGTSKQLMTKVMDLHHATKIDTIADALKALGRELVLTAR